MNNKVILESMASDLKRVALGLQRGSIVMAERFAVEALKRKKEVNLDTIDNYMIKILHDAELALKQRENSRKAEDVLMYSTLIQNFTIKKTNKLI